MQTDRVNAFTDAVVAIAITIMVLELPVPEGASWEALRPALPLFGAYLLSFINIGIFWNNHHHMMHAARHVDGRVLWANLFLLFAISLIPFVIRWIGERGMTSLPVAGYGAVLVLAALAYLLLEQALIRADGEDSKVGRAIGGRWKEWASFALYFVAIGTAFVAPLVAIAIYVLVSAVWFVPDRRFERMREG